MSKLKIASFFAGAGGMDLGFKKSGFAIPWANEYDPTIWDTFEYNFPGTFLDKRSIVDVDGSGVPDVDGFVGGPPCQSWSEAGAGRGIEDKRGKLFYDYIRILKEKQPKFFLAENVSGILHPKHAKAFESILKEFENTGYNITYKLLNANDYGVPQDRLRLIIIGYHKSLNKKFEFPNKLGGNPVLKDAIFDLRNSKPALEFQKTNGNENLAFPNHEYMTGGFSSIYMSRNRVRSWDEPSFTIQAGGRHAPIHPQAPKMIFVETNKRIFAPGFEDKYRRLTVRECARIQTFPDSYVFKYKNVADGYKMVGNAVPVNLAFELAKVIYRDLNNFLEKVQDEELSQKKNKLVMIPS
jgi:DNA (cytosine-5)-methyltransferase 1